MNAQDRRLITWLVVLGDWLPTFTDQVLADDVTPDEWNEFAGILTGIARTCRERGLVPIDIGDSGSR